MSTSERRPRGSAAVPVAPERREELLAAVVDDLLQHGVATLSLRPLAQRLGVSTYSLTYHFDDKHGLLAAAIAHVMSRQQLRIAARLEALADAGPAAAILASWEFLCDHLEEDRLVIEIAVVHNLEIAPALRASLTRSWVEHVAKELASRGMPRRKAEQEATLLQAVMLGLELDLMNTGDRARTTRAIEAYAVAADLRWRGG